RYGQDVSRACHAAPEATRDGVGGSALIDHGLASTSRGNRRRVGRALQRAEHRADHLNLVMTALMRSSKRPYFTVLARCHGCTTVARRRGPTAPAPAPARVPRAGCARAPAPPPRC